MDKIIYIHIDEQHPDSLRYLEDCEKLLGIKIDVLQSPYKSVENVINKRRFINSRYGAECTEILKKKVRKKWEYEQRQLGIKDFTYVWGIDIEETHRKDGIIEGNPHAEHVFPLLDRQLTKADAHAISRRLELKRPIMYDLGYQNNNCIGCVKGGMWYWNKIRVDFPSTFALRSKQEREVNHSCIKGVFLDELDPNRGRPEDEINEDCGVYCMLYS